ncbi:hypothetical protein TWF281_008700 [Arthrobotrys megalospora]
MESCLDNPSPGPREMPRKAPLNFSALPEEILLQILTEVSQSANDSCVVSLVSKRLNRIVTPIIYSTIVLPARKGSSRHGSIDVRVKLQMLRSTIDWAAQYIQHLGIYAPEGPLDIGSYPERAQVCEAVLPILVKIPPGQLRSFMWPYHARPFPPIITHIQKHQQNLETLICYPETITGSLRDAGIPTTPFAFQNLRHMCIRGYINGTQIQELIECIRDIFRKLETLTVTTLVGDQLFWPFMRGNNVKVHPRSQTSNRDTYPLIKTFGCEGDDFWSRLLTNLNLWSISQLPNIRSLYARVCLSQHLLGNIDPKVPILLTTLDVQGCTTRILSEFLLAFQGLRNLDVLIDSGEDYLQPAPIEHHAATLKRLALWRAGGVLTHSVPGLIPIPPSLMASLGDELKVLEEFCAPVPREHDPFEGRRFPALKLIWLYNSNSDPSRLDYPPNYPWTPPPIWAIKDSPEWTLRDSALEREIDLPTTSLPKNLKAVAIGHYARLMNLYRDSEYTRSQPRPGYTASLYEQVGDVSKRIAWKRISMKEFSSKHPGLLSPNENTFGVELLERHQIFRSTELSGMLDPSGILPYIKPSLKN